MSDCNPATCNHCNNDYCNDRNGRYYENNNDETKWICILCDKEETCDECGRTETECQAQATNEINPITQWVGYGGVMCDDCYYEKYASDGEEEQQ